jgi:integrase
MGRKEGGSLFHQFISTPDLFILQNRTDKDGKPMQVSFQTRKSYMEVLYYAAAYFKSEGIRRKSDITNEDVQGYEQHLEEKGCSASTIHSYLSPLCKATGVAMKDVQKPTRQASEFKRGSKSRKSDGGRPGELNAMLGIRKDELRKLRGNDIIERNGDLYVIVRQGKGGKYHEQLILPHYAETVKKFFDGTDNKIFRRDEFRYNFDYHGQRRKVAQEAYNYYESRLTEPNFRKELYAKIARQWHANNKKHRDKLEPLSFFDKPYKLRGKNRELAIKQGKPTELDRLVLRAVSVLHLAHWRDKVTVQSYFFDR